MNLCNFYIPCKNYAILCVLDATFGVSLWPQLNWCNIHVPGFSKQILRNINDCYYNGCYSFFELPILKIFLISSYFLYQFHLFALKKFAYTKVYNFLGGYNDNIAMTECQYLDGTSIHTIRILHSSMIN